LSRPGDCFGCEDVLLEKALTDELLQVPPEDSAMDSLVSFAIVVGIILFCSGMREVVLDGSQTPDPWLILDGVEGLVDWELQWSELLYRLVGSERAR